MTSSTTPPTFTQSEFASVMGVDRGTVKNWQTAGLPYRKTGRGKAAEYPAPLCVLWGLGYQISRRPRTKDPLRSLRGPLDPLALQVALTQASGGEAAMGDLPDQLEELTGITRDEFLLRVGFYRGVLGE